MREPYVPLEVVRYLEQAYSLSELLQKSKVSAFNSDVTIGFMKGTYDVIDRLKALATREVVD